MHTHIHLGWFSSRVPPSVQPFFQCVVRACVCVCVCTREKHLHLMHACIHVWLFACMIVYLILLCFAIWFLCVAWREKHVYQASMHMSLVYFILFCFALSFLDTDIVQKNMILHTDIACQEKHDVLHVVSLMERCILPFWRTRYRLNSRICMNQACTLHVPGNARVHVAHTKVCVLLLLMSLWVCIHIYMSSSLSHVFSCLRR